MLTLLKKDSLNFIMSLAMFLTFITAYWATNKSSLDESMVLTSGSYIYLMVFLPVFINEQQEYRSNGYDFLDILPIKAIEIVASKFLLALIAVVSVLIYDFILFSLFPASHELMVIAISYILFSGMICLLITALIYIGIYGFDRSKFILIIPIFFVSIFFVPILVYEFIILKLVIDINEVVSALENINWIVIIGGVIIIYLLLMAIAAKLKERREG